MTPRQFVEKLLSFSEKERDIYLDPFKKEYYKPDIDSFQKTGNWFIENYEIIKEINKCTYDICMNCKEFPNQLKIAIKGDEEQKNHWAIWNCLLKGIMTIDDFKEKYSILLDPFHQN